MDRSSKRPGRRPGQSTTRDRIIAEARELFANVDYDHTTIRAVAEQAEVDPALVMHFFKSKQELFIAAMAPYPEMPRKISRELAGDSRTLGLRLATLFVSMLESKTTNQVIIGSLRAAVRLPGAALLLRKILVKPILKAFKESNKLDNPELRAALVQSQLVGVAVTRYILKLEPVASVPADELVRHLAPTLQRYLTGDLNPKELNN